MVVCDTSLEPVFLWFLLFDLSGIGAPNTSNSTWSIQSSPRGHWNTEPLPPCEHCSSLGREYYFWNINNDSKCFSLYTCFHIWEELFKYLLHINGLSRKKANTQQFVKIFIIFFQLHINFKNPISFLSVTILSPFLHSTMYFGSNKSILSFAPKIYSKIIISSGFYASFKPSLPLSPFLNYWKWPLLRLIYQCEKLSAFLWPACCYDSGHCILSAYMPWFCQN